jgi:CBS domain-containing protein
VTRRNQAIFEEVTMKVSEAMTRDVQIANPQETIQQAAKMMASLDAGALPVGDNDRLVGMITDRDIAIRGVASGKGPDAKVRDVMTQDVKYCFEDQDVQEITRNMSDIQVRRLPVLNREKRLVGILSLGDIAAVGDGRAGDALRGISRPGGAHTQTG